MLAGIRRAPYFASLAASIALGRPLPAIGGISITDVCNLDCRHCWRKNGGRGHAPFPMVRRALERLHAMGARYLYIQGGEAFLWEDGPLRLADVVLQARRQGFFHVAVCTNGTFPLEAEADSFSVSLEGRRETHDRIRCGSFERVMANLAAGRGRHVFLNATFNRENVGDLEYLARLAAQRPYLRGLLVNFHIPYPGVEGLSLSQEDRRRVSLRAMELKRGGLPIMNSFGGLRALAANDWRRPIGLSVVTDCRETYNCCRARGMEEVCRGCGYGLWAEAARVLAWDPEVMWAAWRRLHSR
ncbi:MAG: radical SAM protein [Elusimicrobia bacterium]|nr:radical SAM protein [Elusimicrobiota bacterium]